MESEQKKYKIEKIEKYGQEWYEIKEHLKDVYKIGFGSLSAAIFAGVGFNELVQIAKISPPFHANIIGSILITMFACGSIGTVMSMKEAIIEIYNKTKLEKKIDKLDAALLEIDEEETNNIRGGR